MIQYPTDFDFILANSDEDLIKAYQRMSGEPGDDEASRLLAEIERRHLAFVLEVDERELGARDPWIP